MAKKIRPEINVSEEVKEAVQKAARDGRMPCQVGLALAKELKVSPAEVGEAANRLDIRIVKCQLGCFE